MSHLSEVVIVLLLMSPDISTSNFYKSSLYILRHMRATVKVFKQCIVKPSSLERTDRERERERRTNILIFVKVLLRFALGFVLIPAL